MADDLGVRIALLEDHIYGREGELKDKKDSEIALSIKQKVDYLQGHVDGALNSIPPLKVCQEIVSKISPILFRQQFSVAQTESKIDDLLSFKSQLLESITTLHDIARLEPIVNRPFLEDIPSQIQKINDLDKLIEILRLKVSNQTRELDQFLDIYQKSMEIITQELERLSEKCNTSKCRIE